MHLVDAGSRQGSSELYDKLMQKCDEQISILILGNTLTTTVGDSGSRALGDVQKSEEEAIMEDDRGYVLDVLNYEMSPIFAKLGINTEGGEWVFVQNEKLDRSQQADIVVKMNSLGLPISDDYLYDTFDIEKPENYDDLIKQKEEQKQAMLEAMKQTQNTPEGDDPKDDKKPVNASLINRILGFFASARKAGNRSMEW